MVTGEFDWWVWLLGLDVSVDERWRTCDSIVVVVIVVIVVVVVVCTICMAACLHCCLILPLPTKPY